MQSAGDILKPLTGDIKEQRYAVVDIETKKGETQEAGFTRPFLAGYYDGEQYYETKGKDCLVQMVMVLLSPDRDGMRYYAHNGGGFDWLHILPVIHALGYYFEVLTVSSSIQMLVVKKSEKDHSKGWTFLDSFKLIPTSLAAACKSFGTSQKLGDHDLNLHEDSPEWSKYLKQDCVSLFQVLKRFHTLVEHRLHGEVGITAASTAMKTFRRGYQAHAIERHTEHHSFFRACYYGGRVEIFKKQATGLHYYDINSAYPHAMLAPMPCGNCFEARHEKPSGALAKGRVGFAWARVDMPRVHVPCLPQKCEETGRLIFPVGKLKGYWSAVELERAEQMGATVHWDRSYWIEAKPILAPYVEALYQYRDKSRSDYDEGLAQTAKILLNSLYGKFCMSHERSKIVILKPGDAPPHGARAADPKDPDCAVWHVSEEVDAPYIIPQISAYITALARLRLHDFLLLAAEGGELAYCDTDSVQTTANLDHLCGSKLGMIKDEGEGATYSGEFLLPKLYCLTDEATGESKIAMKGYEKDGRKENGKRYHSASLFNRAKNGETITFERLEKIGAMAQKQFSSGPQMNMVKRQLRSKDKKREYLDNGDTRALYLEQW